MDRPIRAKQLAHRNRFHERRRAVVLVASWALATPGANTPPVIDLDPQATACNWNDRREADTPVVIDAQASRLPMTLETARANGVDFVVIDTPARSEGAALAAARASALVIIPCRPQAYDLETIPKTQELLQLAGNTPALAMLNAVPPRGTRHEQARDFLGKSGRSRLPADNRPACNFRRRRHSGPLAPCFTRHPGDHVRVWDRKQGHARLRIEAGQRHAPSRPG